MADVGENEVFTDPATALSQGKRHLLVRDYEMAVTALSQACGLLAEKYGDLADELGEPYLLYGRALLGSAREEAGVLGGGVPGNEEAEEDDEDVEEDEDDAGEDKPSNEEETNDETTKEPEQKSEKSTEKSTVESEETPKTSGSTSETTSESKDAKQKTDTTESVKTNVNGESSHEKENDEEDTNEEEEGQFSNNLQVAWEVLELGKIVLSKRGPSGSKLLAEAYRLLGEVAMESGNYKTALNDFQGCLKLLQQLEPIEARAVAEIHYQLGLAYSLGNEFDSSIEEFKKASVLLESRIKELQAMTEPPKTDDPFYTVEGEIQELRELLPEIQDKITDMKDFKQEAYKLIIEEIKSQSASSCSNGAGPSGSNSSSSAGGSGSGSGSGSSSTSSAVPQASKPASDISHLVRKKRKPEDEVPPPSPCKKPTPEKKE